MNLDEKLQSDLSPDTYCLVHNKIINLQQENKQLKDNWNKLKEFVLKKQAVLFNTEYTCYSNILDKMQEIEQGDLIEK